MDEEAVQKCGCALGVSEQNADPHPVMSPLHTTVSLWDVLGFSGRSGVGHSSLKKVKNPTKTIIRRQAATKPSWTNLAWPRTLKSLPAHNCAIHKGRFGIGFRGAGISHFLRCGAKLAAAALGTFQMSCCPSHPGFSWLKNRNLGTAHPLAPCPAPNRGAPRGGAQKPGDLTHTPIKDWTFKNCLCPCKALKQYGFARDQIWFDLLLKFLV